MAQRLGAYVAIASIVVRTVREDHLHGQAEFVRVRPARQLPQSAFRLNGHEGGDDRVEDVVSRDAASFRVAQDPIHELRDQRPELLQDGEAFLEPALRLLAVPHGLAGQSPEAHFRVNLADDPARLDGSPQQGVHFRDLRDDRPGLAGEPLSRDLGTDVPGLLVVRRREHLSNRGAKNAARARRLEVLPRRHVARPLVRVPRQADRHINEDAVGLPGNGYHPG